ncbi:MAG: TetR/AcrR family transcriptional regulator [Defluviitaleaceae bacterium]|nr:TetR/AcrR family transcriptional regulator [Defluviitaleaceae bacterium]
MKEDRRVRKTKKALREGLVALLNEKSIRQITVQELAGRVDIHRSTFYANFKDIYDLLSHVEDTMVEEISQIVTADFAFDPAVFFSCLCNYVRDNRQAARLFFAGNTNIAFFERLTELFTAGCIACWQRSEAAGNVSQEMEYYVQFCLSGALGAIGRWVAQDFAYPMDKLVRMLAEVDGMVGAVFNARGCAAQ